MTLTVDNDYGWLAIALRNECEKRNIEFDVAELNGNGFGDVLYVTEQGTYSGEIKSGGELLGGLAHCEAQLQKQLKSADRCFLAVYGKVEPAEDGSSYALESPSNERVHYDHGPDSGISRTYKRRAFRQNYLGYRTWLARLVSLGVDVYEVPSREALVTQLLALHTVLTTEGGTLRRVIVEKPHVSEADPAKARFMRTVIGVDGAEWGEELADAASREFTHFAQFYEAICMNPHGIATLRLRSGKRSVGAAAVNKMRKALGVES